MGLQKFSVLLTECIRSKSKDELECHIDNLKKYNDGYQEFLYSSIMTSNTEHICQNIRFNEFLIRLCEDRLEKMGVE